ncbi:hypothetical protein [Bifidobacterium breve]
MCERENAADALADLQAWVGKPFDAAGRRYEMAARNPWTASGRI